VGEFLDAGHDWRKSGDGARAQMVAVGKATG
jgi:hypothetical protein